MYQIINAIHTAMISNVNVIADHSAVYSQRLLSSAGGFGRIDIATSVGLLDSPPSSSEEVVEHEKDFGKRISSIICYYIKGWRSTCRMYTRTTPIAPSTAAPVNETTPLPAYDPGI